MISYKTKEQIEYIRESAQLVSKTLAEIAKVINEGVTGLEIDALAETFINDNNAKPMFKGYNGFPNTLCISINEAVVHGVPTSKSFRSGDIVSVDCGVLLNGYVGDSAFTFEIGKVNEETKKLLKVTRESLELGIEKAIVNNRLGDISGTIQDYVQARGYSVVRELVGHGVGKQLHEAPEVPNYGKVGTGILLKEGLVIAVEPMINLGKRHISQLEDGWTIVTKDKSPSAHFEHTIAVAKGKVDVLSTFQYIDAALMKNRL